MKIALISLFAIFSSFLICNQQEQRQEEIVEFEFNSFSRGYSKIIKVNPDSVMIRELSRTNPGGKKEIKRKTREEEWERMVEAVSDHKLEELEDLPSPGMERARDAARHSNIIIRTNKAEYNSGSFDGTNPNRKLEELMQAFLEIAHKSSH